ncbi:SH3 domain-containing protein [Salipaludibacillus agaradhaerens]|uniref:SH3 domain-containing protein n=1 Tax=Salipaludibacillus agaradhaerens TaxID=76935 RepID=UPI0009975912|nr:SH3 domain-containing protein [Salipaludibacillus agaradhaerens]
MEDKKIYLVTKQHTSNYPSPISLLKGQDVIVGTKYEGKEDWNNWIYCYTKDNHLEGWVPEQIIHIQGEDGVILEDYTAKELNVKVGEELVKIKELNGWLWVKKASHAEEGWVPKENVKVINKQY